MKEEVINIIQEQAESMTNMSIPFHLHNGWDVNQLDPAVALLGFPVIQVPDATVSPTDVPVSGTFRFYVDTTPRTILWVYAVYSTSLGVLTGSWKSVVTGSSGTVTSVSVVSANGLAGTVATATTTPAITLSTTISGILKGNGTAISVATSGTDYAPATTGSAVLKGNGAGGFATATNTDLPSMTSTQGGGVPTPPNNTSTFLRGDGTFATPSGASVIYKNGITAKILSDASTTQNIPHGLGVTPSQITITWEYPQGNVWSYGYTVYNGTTCSTQGHFYSNGAYRDINGGTNVVILYESANNTTFQTGTITMDAINIIITWVKTGSPAGTSVNMLWTAQT